MSLSRRPRGKKRNKKSEDKWIEDDMKWVRDMKNAKDKMGGILEFTKTITDAGDSMITTYDEIRNNLLTEEGQNAKRYSQLVPNMPEYSKKPPQNDILEPINISNDIKSTQSNKKATINSSTDSISSNVYKKNNKEKIPINKNGRTQLENKNSQQNTLKPSKKKIDLKKSEVGSEEEKVKNLSRKNKTNDLKLKKHVNDRKNNKFDQGSTVSAISETSRDNIDSSHNNETSEEMTCSSFVSGNNSINNGSKSVILDAKDNKNFEEDNRNLYKTHGPTDKNPNQNPNLNNDSDIYIPVFYNNKWKHYAFDIIFKAIRSKLNKGNNFAIIVAPVENKNFSRDYDKTALEKLKKTLGKCVKRLEVNGGKFKKAYNKETNESIVVGVSDNENPEDKETAILKDELEKEIFKAQVTKNFDLLDAKFSQIKSTGKDFLGQMQNISKMMGTKNQVVSTTIQNAVNSGSPIDEKEVINQIKNAAMKDNKLNALKGIVQSMVSDKPTDSDFNKARLNDTRNISMTDFEGIFDNAQHVDNEELDVDFRKFIVEMKEIEKINDEEMSQDSGTGLDRYNQQTTGYRSRFIKKSQKMKEKAITKLKKAVNNKSETIVEKNAIFTAFKEGNDEFIGEVFEKTLKELLEIEVGMKSVSEIIQNVIKKNSNSTVGFAFDRTSKNEVQSKLSKLQDKPPIFISNNDKQEMVTKVLKSTSEEELAQNYEQIINFVEDETSNKMRLFLTSVQENCKETNQEDDNQEEPSEFKKNTLVFVAKLRKNYCKPLKAEGDKGESKKSDLKSIQKKLQETINKSSWSTNNKNDLVQEFKTNFTDQLVDKFDNMTQKELLSYKKTGFDYVQKRINKLTIKNKLDKCKTKYDYANDVREIVKTSECEYLIKKMDEQFEIILENQQDYLVIEKEILLAFEKLFRKVQNDPSLLHWIEKKVKLAENNDFKEDLGSSSSRKNIKSENSKMMQDKNQNISQLNSVDKSTKRRYYVNGKVPVNHEAEMDKLPKKQKILLNGSKKFQEKSFYENNTYKLKYNDEAIKYQRKPFDFQKLMKEISGVNYVGYETDIHIEELLNEFFNDKIRSDEFFKENTLEEITVVCKLLKTERDKLSLVVSKIDAMTDVAKVSVHQRQKKNWQNYEKVTESNFKNSLVSQLPQIQTSKLTNENIKEKRLKTDSMIPNNKNKMFNKVSPSIPYNAKDESHIDYLDYISKQKLLRKQQKKHKYSRSLITNPETTLEALNTLDGDFRIEPIHNTYNDAHLQNELNTHSGNFYDNKRNYLSPFNKGDVNDGINTSVVINHKTGNEWNFDANLSMLENYDKFIRGDKKTVVDKRNKNFAFCRPPPISESSKTVVIRNNLNESVNNKLGVNNCNLMIKGQLKGRVSNGFDNNINHRKLSFDELSKFHN